MHALLNQHRFAEAIASSERMIAVLQASGNEEDLAETWFCRGVAEARVGHLQAAVASLRDAYAINAKLGRRGHAARALAAEGRIGLASASPEVRDKGAYRIQQAVCMKLGCEDRGGIGRDFMMLSEYALGLKQMSRALGYGRRGLRLSFMQGNPTEIASALVSLLEVYLACRLYGRAERTTKEALAWAERSRSTEFVAVALSMRARVVEAQKGRGSEPKKFICPCPTNEARKSNGEKRLEFKDCCGPADRDPVEVDWGFCLAPQHGPYRANPDTTAYGLTLGEYVDRQASKDKPEGFLVARIHDGWLETFGLSCMANYHLRGARAACEAVGGPTEVGFPIAAVLHATCSLEAFMNGLAHIAPSLKASFKDSRLAVASWSDRTEPEIVTKWVTAGSLFCTEGWLEPELLKSMRKLVRLRNRLVHFEPRREALDEPPDDVPLLGDGRRTRGLWWPHGELDGDTALWAASTAERLMAAFRSGLREESRALRGSEDLLVKM
ncbi:tetratricopeptide repeat protein [Methylorubrum rhodesianum]|uniref:Tetratricopeptide repeat protein n=1 Tax=Methylorubrum rhodesianum TaxID=29427 RepID=A0ABU9ZGL7_9HYPH